MEKKQQKVFTKESCNWVNYKLVIIQNEVAIVEINWKYYLLDLRNHATVKEIEHATGVDTSDLVAKKILLLWNAKKTNQILMNWLMSN